MSGLPLLAIDPMVMAEVEMQPVTDPDHWGCEERACGCSLRSDKWWLCRYHDGMNDGLAMASGRRGAR